MIKIYRRFVGLESFHSHATVLPKGVEDDGDEFYITEVDDSWREYGFTQEELDYIKQSLDKGHRVEGFKLGTGVISIAIEFSNDMMNELWEEKGFKNLTVDDAVEKNSRLA